MAKENMKHVPVFYSSNENYAKPLTVSMYSVLANTSHHIDFYVMENDINPETKQKMRESLKEFDNFTLNFIRVNDGGLEGCPNLLWYTKCAYFRYLIPELCPHVNKAVYLDVDIILKSDIEELFSMDLDGFSLGAAAGERSFLDQFEWQRKHLESIGVSKTHNYFNSGVLLIDLELWRDLGMTDTLIKTTQKLSYLLRFADQDVLNIIFDNNQFKDIGFLWGGLNVFAPQEMKENKELVDAYRLVHFCGQDKPWHKICEFDSWFWKYAKQTVFYSRPSLFQVWSLFFKYFFCLSSNRSDFKKEYKWKKWVRAVCHR